MVKSIRVTLALLGAVLFVGVAAFGCAASAPPVPDYPDPGDPPLEQTELWSILEPEPAPAAGGAEPVDDEPFEDLPEEAPAEPEQPAPKKKKGK